VSRLPLDGVTVLEVGVFLAAPFATMQLADLGARVVKVENPSAPDPVRLTGPLVEGQSPAFAQVNRNKESVALDLKIPAGRAAFLELVRWADVVVENLRPGAMRRLGLGPEDLQAVNPQIVCASASGWGQSGPLTDRPGLDIMAQARGGLMSITGDPDGDPVKCGVPIADLSCALYLALAVTAALHARDRDGRGQVIDVSLYESVVSLAVWEAARFFGDGGIGGRLGSAHQSLAPYQALRTADGHVTVGAVTPATWSAFCAALSLHELVDDPRFRTAGMRHDHRAELIPRIEAVTGVQSTAEVVAALEAVGVPCAPIADYGQVFTDEHLAARDFFWSPDPGGTPGLTHLGSPMRLADGLLRRDSAGPVLGQDTHAVLAEAGLAGEQIDALLAAGTAVQAGGSAR
jgi:crotonobetainyl-CoA:carnitine CoA-transferase CaiB-like acyl-CoA transferase